MGVKIVKKTTRQFKRHQYDRRAGSVHKSWRRPKGIDSSTRRKFKGHIPMPNIGYGSDKRTRNMLPSGLYNAVVNNMTDLEALMMHSKRFCCTIGSSVGARSRKALVERAKQLNITVTNGKARLTTEDHE
ncbi:unnamed protein product [Pedinophyceae sp. YPF-701]|nr:unnamed protein product [Pedinophyceae sp. YPF-701]